MAKTKLKKNRKKLTARRLYGRPRAMGPREPSGRLQRMKDETERAATETVRNQRVKHYGADPENATDSRLGSYIGRIGLTDAEYDALTRWHEIYLNYAECLEIPRGYKSCLAGGVGGHDNIDPECPDYQEKVRNAKRRWDGAYAALGEILTDTLIGAVNEIQVAPSGVKSAAIALCNYFGISNELRKSA